MSTFKTINLLALTQGISVPSARFRWRQYSEELSNEGIISEEIYTKFGAYPPAQKIHRIKWAANIFLETLQRVYNSKRYDLTFLQRNLVSNICTFEPFLSKPFIFDVDDAIFLGPYGWSNKLVAKKSALTICGNTFLANYFYPHCPVKIVPTGVDTDRYTPFLKRPHNPNIFNIGWSGSSSGHKYIYLVEDALATIIKKYPFVTLTIISDLQPVFKLLPNENVNFQLWSVDTEISGLSNFDVGIMPLEDSPWERGKCSYKMLTYMSMEIPVVVSPVGMNIEIMSKGFCGYLAKSKDDWVSAISELIKNHELRCKNGFEGRKIVLNNYSRDLVSKDLAKIIHGAL